MHDRGDTCSTKRRPSRRRSCLDGLDPRLFGTAYFGRAYVRTGAPGRPEAMATGGRLGEMQLDSSPQRFYSVQGCGTHNDAKPAPGATTMQKQFGLILCGLAVGLLGLWWIRPDSDAGSTLLVVFALLSVQAIAAVSALIGRSLGKRSSHRALQPGTQGDRPGVPPPPCMVIVFTALALSPAIAQQQERHISIIVLNRTQQSIDEVYISPISQSNWGSDRLSSSVVEPGERVSVELNRNDGCKLDIRVVYSGGRAEEKRGVDACNVHEIVFTASGSSIGSGHFTGILGGAGSGQSVGRRNFNLGGGTFAVPPLGFGLRNPPPLTPDSLVPSNSAIPLSPLRLTPARVFMPAGSIPPAGVGAYGVMALRALPTPASLARFTMACTAFLASLPPQADLPASVPLSEQMLTIWPLKEPEPGQERAQLDCPTILQRYDLQGGLAAVRDAASQDHPLEGRGPFLIGWSPSNMRGVRDAIVLIVDMSNFDSQQSFDDAFLFWQRKVVEDPQLWQHGFSLERLRLSVRDFVDHYGASIESAIKIWGGSG